METSNSDGMLKHYYDAILRVRSPDDAERLLCMMYHELRAAREALNDEGCDYNYLYSAADFQIFK